MQENNGSIDTRLIEEASFYLPCVHTSTGSNISSASDLLSPASKGNHFNSSEDELCKTSADIVENVVKLVALSQRDDIEISEAFETGVCSVEVCQKISVNFEDAVCETEKASDVTCEHLEVSSKLISEEVTSKVLLPSEEVAGCCDEEASNGNSEKEHLLGQNKPNDNVHKEISGAVDQDTTIVSVTPYSVYLFDEHKTILVSRTWKEFKRKGKNSFLKGCKWAPDGLCILTNNEDKKLKIFDLPQELYTQKIWPKDNVDLLPDLKKTVEVSEGGRVYDYCWYPLMNSWDVPSCCFVSSSTDEPVHLWDAFDGTLRATYQSRNYAEEVMSPFSLNFSPDGEKLFCGFKNKVDVFSVVCPGVKPTSFNTKALTGQTGLVSTIAVNPALPDLFAVGTFQKSVGLYSLADKCGICVFNGHSGGLTHLIFSPDGSRLYTGSRMDPEIVCWDLRSPGKVLFSMYRSVSTNQRIYFDLTPDGKFLVSGNTDGRVSIWDLQSDKLLNGDVEPVEPDIIFQAHNDCTNGVSINRRYPILATSSGQRHFPDIVDDQNCSGNLFDCDSLVNKKEDCINLWWIGPVS